MTLAAGSVVVSDAGEVTTKTGAAGAVYDALVANATLLDPESRPSTYVGSEADWRAFATKSRNGYLKEFARNANSIAALIPYLVANMVVHVPTNVAGIQALPVTLVAGTDCVASSSPPTLIGTVT